MKRFAFFIHPLNFEDVVRVAPQAANKRQPLVEKILEWTPAHEVSHITGLISAQGEEAEGWFIVLPLLPHMFLSLPKEKVFEKVMQGAEIARKHGAQILGLGGFSSIIGNGGVQVAEMIPDIPVTSGNSYTIATSIEATVEASRRLGMDLNQVTATVVGASGSIGSVCAQLLAPHVKKMVLVARNVKRLEKIAEVISGLTGKMPSLFSDVSMGIRKSDIIITATSSSGNIITPHDIKTGALICDVSLPHDVCREVAHLRPDVLVIEGGLIEVPRNVTLNYDFGYPPDVALACMSETMALTLEGRFEVYSIGRGIKLEKVKEIAEIAKKQGFRLAGFRSFDKIVTDEMIERVRTLSASRKKDEELRKSAG
ncbi:MAG: shikimate dehydrogenase [Candidatus Xenobiia bacterium LiM19]